MNTNEYWNRGTRRLRSKIRRRSTETTTPGGYFSPRGDSPYGCADMSGNVWEWTSTIYKEYPYKFDDGREATKADGDRVLRGGSFRNYLWFARCALRRGSYPSISPAPPACLRIHSRRQVPRMMDNHPRRHIR